MAEKWVSTSKGSHLAGRPKVNTKPEVELRKAIHAAGGRFRLHQQLTQGCTPDIVMPGRRLAIFVDGCFWHGCPEHGRKKPWSGPNAELWERKLRRNRERDKLATQLAIDRGWNVVRIWECCVLADPASVARQIMRTNARTGEE